MKTLDIRDKDIKKSFKQVKRWFERNPNRKQVVLEDRNNVKIIVKREEYIKN